MSAIFLDGQPREGVLFKTRNLSVRFLLKDDITESYVAWMNHPVVRRFILSCQGVQTLESIHEWVRNTQLDPAREVLGVFYQNEHIGNLTLYMIEPENRCLRIGICIGKSGYETRGFSIEAFRGCMHFLFEDLGFNRLETTICQDNVASQKLMTLVGFSKDVVLRKRLYFEGKFTDLILYSCLRENYRQD